MRRVRRWLTRHVSTLEEVAGVLLIAGALAFVHVAFALAAVGAWLLATAVLEQFGAGQGPRGKAGE